MPINYKQLTDQDGTFKFGYKIIFLTNPGQLFNSLIAAKISRKKFRWNIEPLK